MPLVAVIETTSGRRAARMESEMRKFLIAAAASLAALFALPSVASAATGYVTTDLNVRAGPSTAYPAVTVFPGGSRVDVIGCTSGPGWCDVRAGGIRGWVSANYLDLSWDNRRVRAPRYVGRVGVPTVTFSIGTYWDDHYRSRSFYHDRDRYDRRHHWRGRHDRHDAREARREFRRDLREARREWRQARREARREFRQDRREWRRERREWRRDRDWNGPRLIRRID